MLRKVPGVQVRQDYGGGNRLDISIRGIEAGRGRKVLILEDGIPMALNPYSESDLNFAPPVERMRGIEVVKGSGNILFGPQTLTGVINFVTLAPPPGTRVVLDAEAGQRGYARGLVNYGDTVGGVRYVAQVFNKRGDGFRDIGFDVLDAFGKVAFDTSQKGELTLKVAYHNETNDSDAVGLTREMYAADPRRNKIAENDRMRLDYYQVAAIHEQRFSNTLKLKTLAYAYKTDRLWRRQDYTRTPGAGEAYTKVVGDPTFPGGAIFFKDSAAILDRRYDVVGVEPRLELRFDTGDVKHTIDTGARLLYESAHYMQRSGGNATTWSGSLDFEERHGTFAQAAYVQDRIAFRDDLLVTPGVRFERADFRRNVTRQLTPAGVSDVDLRGSNLATGVIPGVGMVFGTRNLHAFGGLHLGWAPPRIAAQVSARGAPSQVGAEESINYELGTRFNVKRWLRFEGAGFLSNFRNQVVINTQPGGAELVDGGPTRVFGAETSAVFGLGALFKWLTIVDVGARYTFARATFVGGPNGGRLLPYAPLHNLSTNLDVEHPSGLGGQLAYTHTSDQYSDLANTMAVDASGRAGLLGARNIVDLTAHYKHAPTGLAFRVTVKNAFDDVYVISRRPEGIFPSGFRQVTFGVRWTYEKKESE